MAGAVINVAFDECGNTGQHLLDPEQAVFALASVCFSEGEAANLLSRFAARYPGEIKYTKLKNARRNQELILSLLQEVDVRSETCKIYPIHKPFMLVTKLVDNIYETLAHEDGIDLYENRAALATANLITTVYPTYLGKTRFYRFLGLFNQLVRKPTPEAYLRFSKEVRTIYDLLERKFPHASSTFAPVVVACQRGLPFLSQLGVASDHDPIIPAYYVLVDEWGKELGKRYCLIADESTVLEKEKERLLKFSDPAMKPVKQMVYAFTTEYPFKIDEIRIVKSQEYDSIQLADFFSGVACHALNWRAQGAPGTEFEKKLFETLFSKRLVIGGMWPSSAVTPEELEATGEYTGNPAELAMKILQGDSQTNERDRV